MALTLVSKLDFLPGYASSGSRVCLCVCALEPRGLYPSVDLRRGDRRMSEHLLDRTQVGAAVQQMRRERGAGRVGGEGPGQRRLPRPDAQPPRDVGCGEPAPRLRQEGRRRAPPLEVERGPPPLDVVA